MGPATKGTPVPTLYVGLGGTGKDVLLRLRWWIFDKWRRPSLPFTKFLWLDTDVQGTMPGEIPEVIQERINFGQEEKIALGMKKEEVEGYLTGAVVDNLKSSALRARDWLPTK